MFQFVDDLFFFFDMWITLNLYAEYRISAYSYYFQYRTTNELHFAQGIQEKGIHFIYLTFSYYVNFFNANFSVQKLKCFSFKY